MNTSTNPLIRPQSPFERRMVNEIDRAKPGRSVGVTNKPLPGGTSQTIQTKRGGNSQVHPFFILPSGLIHAGTVNSVIPTLSGSPIGESGSALSLTGSKYVYIQNIWDISFGSFHYLVSATLDTSIIVTNPTPLSDETDLTEGTVTTYKLIAQIIDGVVQRAQQTTTNLGNSICDNSNGTAEGKAVSSNWYPA